MQKADRTRLCRSEGRKDCKVGGVEHGICLDLRHRQESGVIQAILGHYRWLDVAVFLYSGPSESRPRMDVFVTDHALRFMYEVSEKQGFATILDACDCSRSFHFGFSKAYDNSQDVN